MQELNGLHPSRCAIMDTNVVGSCVFQNGEDDGNSDLVVDSGMFDCILIAPALVECWGLFLSKNKKIQRDLDLFYAFIQRGHTPGSGVFYRNLNVDFDVIMRLKAHLRRIDIVDLCLAVIADEVSRKYGCTKKNALTILTKDVGDFAIIREEGLIFRIYSVNDLEALD